MVSEETPKIERMKTYLLPVDGQNGGIVIVMGHTRVSLERIQKKSHG